MTIAEDASQPAAVTGTGTSAVTGSFTPPANSLLIAISNAGNTTGSTATTAPVTDSLSSVWTLLKRANNGASGSSEVWGLDAGASPAARTVTVTGTGGANAIGVALTVRVLTGANPVASCMGASATLTNQTAYTIALTSTTAGSLVLGGLVDDVTAGALTVNGVTTAWQSVTDASNTEKYAAWRATSLTGSPGSVTYGFTNVAANNQSITAVEILPAASGNFAIWPGPRPGPIGTPSQFRPWTGTGTPPVAQASATPFIGEIITARTIASTIRLPRGRVFPLPPPAVVVVQPMFVAPQIGGRSPAAPTSRLPRGQFFVVPQVAVAFVYPQIGVRHPNQPPGRLPRGRFASMPRVALGVIPAQIGARRPSNPFPRGTGYRGKFIPVPTAPLATLAKVTRSAIRWPGTVRRGAIFSVPVPATVIAPTGPVIPKTVRLAIHWPGPVRRGKIFFIPSSSQAAPTVTPIPPRMIQQHQQTRVLARRGKILPFIGGQPGWVPPPTRPSSPVGARGARPGMTPRGRRWITPTTPTGPILRPPIGPARRILAVRPPRGRFLPMPYPPAVVVPPPLYVARIMRQRARFWYFARRGRLQFTRLTGAAGFPAEFASASRALDMIGAGSAVEMVTNATTGSAEFAGGDRGVTFVDGDTGTEFRSGP